MKLQTVELEGSTTGKVKLTDVVSVAKLDRGTNLLKLSTDKVARRIETLPWVSDAAVERILPSKIRVRVVERRPSFVVMAGPVPWLADEDGVILQQAEMGLLHFLDMPLPPLSPGLRLRVAHFKHASRIVRSLPGTLRGRLNLVRAASIDRITLELTDGSAVIYGAAEEMADKNHSAKKLLELYDGRGIAVESIDVRVPDRPAVKPRAVLQGAPGA